MQLNKREGILIYIFLLLLMVFLGKQLILDKQTLDILEKEQLIADNHSKLELMNVTLQKEKQQESQLAQLREDMAIRTSEIKAFLNQAEVLTYLNQTMMNRNMIPLYIKFENPKNNNLFQGLSVEIEFQSHNAELLQLIEDFVQLEGIHLMEMNVTFLEEEQLKGNMTIEFYLRNGDGGV